MKKWINEFLDKIISWKVDYDFRNISEEEIQEWAKQKKSNPEKIILLLSAKIALQEDGYSFRAVNNSQQIIPCLLSHESLRQSKYSTVYDLLIYEQDKILSILNEMWKDRNRDLPYKIYLR